MGRSGNLVAKYDNLVRELVADPLYKINADGTIWTLKSARNGALTTEWRLAGRIHPQGYIEIRYKGVRLQAHRISYQALKGSLQCDLVVDHKNGIRTCNEPDNLRLVSNRTNALYRERRKNEGKYHAPIQCTVPQGETQKESPGISEETTRIEQVTDMPLDGTTSQGTDCQTISET